MKNLVVLSAFISTIFLGLICTNSFDYSAKFGYLENQNYSQWNDETSDKPLFTLEEANYLIGKKVISHNLNFKNKKIGRIISIEMVEPDRFLVEIYWGKGVMDENSSVTFHDKDLFSGKFEIFD